MDKYGVMTPNTSKNDESELPRRRFLAVTGASLLTLTTAGCMHGNGGGNSTPDNGTEPVGLEVESHDEYGDILVDGNGYVLYMFDQDEDMMSTCTGSCAENWPPFTVETEDDLEIGDGVEAEISFYERDDGSLQVVAGDWPLYYFFQDEEPGDANGQGANDVWWVVDSSGAAVM